MKTIKFYGHSDDCIEIKGDAPGCDEYNGRFNTDMMPPFDLISAATKSDSLRVFPIYEGCWFFAVGHGEENGKLPDWAIRHSFTGYTNVLEIDCPDDIEVVPDAAYCE